MNTSTAAEAVSIALADGSTVSGLALVPGGASCLFVFAHGAGAGMAHPFMAQFAAGLGARGVATLRYQFPYMEQGSRRPDRPAVAHATVRAAVRKARESHPSLPLIAGGKSFGARMSSQAQAVEALDGVVGLAFIGFPLHPAGKPATERARHLQDVRLPMLFLQGTRDGLAEWALLEPLVAALGAGATMVRVDDADHAFHVRVKSGRTDGEAQEAMLDAFALWAERQVARPA